MTRQSLAVSLIAANRDFFHTAEGSWPGHEGVPARCYACTLHGTVAAEAVADLLELPRDAPAA